MISLNLCIVIFEYLFYFIHWLLVFAIAAIRNTTSILGGWCYAMLFEINNIAKVDADYQISWHMMVNARFSYFFLSADLSHISVGWQVKPTLILHQIGKSSIKVSRIIEVYNNLKEFFLCYHLFKNWNCISLCLSLYLSSNFLLLVIWNDRVYYFGTFYWDYEINDLPLKSVFFTLRRKIADAISDTITCLDKFEQGIRDCLEIWGCK